MTGRPSAPTAIDVVAFPTRSAASGPSTSVERVGQKKTGSQRMTPEELTPRRLPGRTRSSQRELHGARREVLRRHCARGDLSAGDASQGNLRGRNATHRNLRRSDGASRNLIRRHAARTQPVLRHRPRRPARPWPRREREGPAVAGAVIPGAADRGQVQPRVEHHRRGPGDQGAVEAHADGPIRVQERGADHAGLNAGTALVVRPVQRVDRAVLPDVQGDDVAERLQLPAKGPKGLRAQPGGPRLARPTTGPPMRGVWACAAEWTCWPARSSHFEVAA